MVNKSNEHTVDLSFGAPSATSKNTSEFSLKPVPPIDIGSMAIVETIGTMKIKDANERLIPSDLAAR
jgi:hypothetical protein